MLWSPNTQLHYPFQNTATDYSGNARNGTVNGSGVYATKPNGGRCLYFDGVGDFVKTPSFGLSGTVIVFASDIRCAYDAGHTQGIFGDEAASTTVGFLYTRRRYAQNDFQWAYANGASTIYAAASNFFASPYNDAWVHGLVVCDYAGKNIYYYRGGTLFATVAMTGTPVFPSTTRVKYVGAYGNNDTPLIAGYLANVQLWTLATMPAAAQMLANAKRIMLGFNPIW